MRPLSPTPSRARVFANPKARFERSPRGCTGSSWELDEHASGHDRSSGRSRPGRRKSTANRMLRITPRVHASYSSSADLVIEVPGVPTAKQGGARRFRRLVASDTRAVQAGSSEDGALAAAAIPIRGRPMSPTVRKRAARPRSGTRVLRNRALKQGSAEQSPPSTVTFGSSPVASEERGRAPCAA